MLRHSMVIIGLLSYTFPAFALDLMSLPEYPGQPGTSCRSAGVFISLEDDPENPAIIYRLPFKVVLAKTPEGRPDATGFAYRMGSTEYVFLQTKVSLVHFDDVERCLRAKFPRAQFVLPTLRSASFDLSPPIPGLLVQNQGSGDSIPEQNGEFSQIIGTLFSGRGLRSTFDKYTVSSLPGPAGNVRWELESNGNGIEYVTSGFWLDDSDSKILVQEALKALANN